MIPSLNFEALKKCLEDWESTRSISVVITRSSVTRKLDALRRGEKVTRTFVTLVRFYCSTGGNYTDRSCGIVFVRSSRSVINRRRLLWNPSFENKFNARQSNTRAINERNRFRSIGSMWRDVFPRDLGWFIKMRKRSIITMNRRVNNKTGSTLGPSFMLYFKLSYRFPPLKFSQLFFLIRAMLKGIEYFRSLHNDR